MTLFSMQMKQKDRGRLRNVRTVEKDVFVMAMPSCCRSRKTTDATMLISSARSAHVPCLLFELI